MKVVIVGENNKARLNKALEAALYIVGYTFSFFITSKMFKSFKLSSDYTIFYALLAVILIYVLNKTIKPSLSSSILAFRVCISGVTISWPQNGYATPGLFSFSGITPIILPPPSCTPRAAAPIRPVLPPPKTRPIPRCAIT